MQERVREARGDRVAREQRTEIERQRDLSELPTKCRGGQLGKEVLLFIYG